MSRTDRLNACVNQILGNCRLKEIQDNRNYHTIIDHCSLARFTELCRAIAGNNSLRKILINTDLDPEQSNEFINCLRENRTVVTIDFTERKYKTDILCKAEKFLIRNSNVGEIIEFINRNFKSESIVKVNPKDYRFLKYYLPFNKDWIKQSLAKLNFESTHDWDHFLTRMHHTSNKTYKLLCKDITHC